MTAKEFYEELAKTGRGWMVEVNGAIRSGDPLQVCPITAVAGRTTERFYSIGDVDEAGKALGLDRRFCVRVIAAADYDTGFIVRKRLLKALGL